MAATHVAVSMTGKLHLTGEGGWSHGVSACVLGPIGEVVIDPDALCGMCMAEQAGAIRRGARRETERAREEAEREHRVAVARANCEAELGRSILEYGECDEIPAEVITWAGERIASGERRLEWLGGGGA